eukprot:TRINITY_DN80957_c0_g1_i1.p1 TRINITY_DN80957_c0_g1~~TRINITY_DN80957_c0_g1_i1.p1  ORF type:complete len:281 (-),score=63.52 TRINITY_DN80957_c0_g1_i1:202-1044(-)
MGCKASIVEIELPSDGLPREIHVFLLKKEGQFVGAHAKPNRRGETILTAVHDGGLLMKWNKRNRRKVIKEGDRLLSVNGISGMFWPMMFEMRSAQRAHLVFLRPLVPYGPFDEPSEDEASRQLVAANVLETMPLVSASSCGCKECTICFEDFAPDEQVLQLPCKHAYHPECAKPWLSEQKGTCPLCGSNVATAWFDLLQKEADELQAQLGTTDDDAEQGRGVVPAEGYSFCDEEKLRALQEELDSLSLPVDDEPPRVLPSHKLGCQKVAFGLRRRTPCSL